MQIDGLNSDVGLNPRQRLLICMQKRDRLSIVAAVRTPVHEDVLAGVRDLIVEGVYPPGTHIPENALCASFGVSRTPMREALKALAAEGLVVLLPRRGAVVNALTLKDVDDVVAVIEALEGLASLEACARITAAQLSRIESMNAEMVACRKAGDLMGYFKRNQDIHEAIVEAAGNDVASAMYRSLLGRIRRYRYVGNTEAQRWDRAVAEHAHFIEALRERDGPLLRQLLRSHLRNGWRASRDLVAEELARNAASPVRILRRPPRVA